MKSDSSPPPSAPIPSGFFGYLRSMGPGIVVVLTWMGAGDLVDASVAGGSYGYALMWVLATALIIRWIFVSAIARYQLCNERGEGLMDGLGRLHRAFPPFIVLATLILSHAVGVYMWQGWGEACGALFGGPPVLWSVATAFLFAALVFRPVFKRIEIVFLVFLAFLTVALLGAAALAGPDWGGILGGTVGLRMPEEQGAFHPMLVATSLIGAVAGSLANLMYPYFIREKGWTTPGHLRVQRYDLALGVMVIIVLDLAVWVLGAEVLHPGRLKVDTIHDIAGILGRVLGSAGSVLFYVGVLAAVGSSVVGNALAYSYMATDAWTLWRAPSERRASAAYRTHPGYRWMVFWCLFSPLVWMLAGKPSFVPLTVAINSFQVVLLPILAIAIWLLTSRSDLIGADRRNRWHDHLGLAVFTAVALLGAWGSLLSLASTAGLR